MQEETTLLEGILSIEAAIRAKSREIHHIYIDREKVKERDRKVMRFLKFIKESGFSAELCARDVIDAYASEMGSTHGGVIAVTGERNYLSIEDLFLKIRSEHSYAVMLDGVEDPFNFGYAIRNLHAAGAGGIIIPKRNWMSASNVCARASAGASELAAMSLMPDGKDEEFQQLLKKKGIGIVCAALSHDSISLFDFKPVIPFVLFIGGEKRGISKVYVENADAIVHIPYANQSVRYSLPTASVAAIFGFELQNKMGNF